MFNYKIIKKIKDCKLYPGEDAVEFQGQIINTDKHGKEILSDVFTLTIPLSTYKLVEYFQTHPCSDELANLIEDYGMDKYRAGADAETESNADAEY